MGDVLHPELYEIDGRVYCDYYGADGGDPFASNNDEGGGEFEEGGWLNEEDDYDEFGDDDDVNDDQQDGEDFEVKQVKNGSFEVRLFVPGQLHAYMIGAKHALRKQMEHETGARINYPQRDAKTTTNGGVATDEPILVTSKHRRGVVSAGNRLNLLARDIRWRVPFTHFVSVDISRVTSAFEKFKRQVLNNRECKIDECLFQKAEKLHLTVCTLHLLNSRERHDCMRHLHAMTRDDLMRGGPLHVRVRGLEVMNDDPSDVDVLYAKIEECDGGDRLQRLCERVLSTLNRAHLAEKQFDRIKLHATLINSKFRPGLAGASTLRLTNSERRRGGGRHRDDDFTRERHSFDASPLLNSPRFRDFDFGRLTVDQILVSWRSFFDERSGYYASLDSLDL